MTRLRQHVTPTMLAEPARVGERPPQGPAMSKEPLPMKTLQNRYKQLWVAILVKGLLLCIDVGDPLAHTPHDVIGTLEISPFYHIDETLFVVVQDLLQKSTDGGITWKQLSRGLDNTHTITSIAISPSFDADTTLFLSTDGDGIYRSTDAGLSWLKINPPANQSKIRALAISPTYASDRILLATGTEGGLYRTNDEGNIWNEVIKASVKIAAIDFPLGMDGNPLVIGDNKGMISVSRDYGDTWKQFFRLLNGDSISCVAISSTANSDLTVFIGTETSGVITIAGTVTADIIINNSLTGTGIPLHEPVTSLTISPNYRQDSIAYASTWHTGVFRSDDGAKTWKKFSTGLTSDPQADIWRFKAPHFSMLRLSRSFSRDRTIFLSGYDGLFKSTDAGTTWFQSDTLSGDLITTLALSPKYFLDSTIAIVTFLHGIYLSKDDGSTWEHINRGLHSNRLLDIAFSPSFSSDDTIFTISNHSFYKSTVKGKSWQRVNLRYHGWRRSLSTILVSLGLPEMLLLRDQEKELTFPTVVVPSPEFRSDHTIYLGTRYQGILKSSNSGQDWSKNFSVLRRKITSLVISPDYNFDKTLYAGISQEGIYKTDDRGKTWKCIYQDTSHNILLVISPDYKADGRVLATTNQGLLETHNHGKDWDKIEISNIDHNVSYQAIALAKIRNDSKIIIVSLKGYGIFKIDSSGEHMSEICPDILYKNYPIKRIVLSPSLETDQRIYFVSDEQIFKSVNGGETCTPVNRPS